MWLGYLVYTLSNCVMKLCIETGLMSVAFELLDLTGSQVVAQAMFRSHQKTFYLIFHQMVGYIL